jgi:hypothetical protein
LSPSVPASGSGVRSPRTMGSMGGTISTPSRMLSPVPSSSSLLSMSKAHTQASPGESLSLPYLPTQPRPVDTGLKRSPTNSLSTSSVSSSQYSSFDRTGSNNSSLSAASTGNNFAAGPVGGSIGRSGSLGGGEKIILTPERAKASAKVTPVRGMPGKWVGYRTAVFKGEHGIGLDLGDDRTQPTTVLCCALSCHNYVLSYYDPTDVHSVLLLSLPRTIRYLNVAHHIAQLLTSLASR